MRKQLDHTKVPQPDLDKLVTMHMHAIHLDLQGKVKAFMPTIIVQHWDPYAEKEEYDIIVIHHDFNEQETKRIILEELGAKYYRDRKMPVGIALASEAWMSHTTHCQPRDADDREEHIVIAARGIAVTPVKFSHMPVARDKDGCIKESPFITRDYDRQEFPLLDHFYNGMVKELQGDAGGRWRK